MKFQVEMTITIDKDHPYIDSLGDQKNAVLTLIEDMLYDDDYIELDEIVVKEDK